MFQIESLEELVRTTGLWAIALIVILGALMLLKSRNATTGTKKNIAWMIALTVVLILVAMFLAGTWPNLFPGLTP